MSLIYVVEYCAGLRRVAEVYNEMLNKHEVTFLAVRRREEMEDERGLRQREMEARQPLSRHCAKFSTATRSAPGVADIMLTYHINVSISKLFSCQDNESE